MDRERGFTLVELLISVAILGILAALALESFVVYKDHAYQSMAVQMMGQTRTAMEAGKMDSERFPESVMAVTQSTPGPVAGATAQLLLPGLVLPDSFHVLVRHDPTCISGTCTLDFIETRHCKAMRGVHFWNQLVTGEAVQIISENVAIDSSC